MTNKPMLSVELRALLERVVKGAPGSTWAALDDDRLAATEELRALLDKPAPEPVPVAWMRFDDDQKAIFTRTKRADKSEPLYAHPTAYRHSKPSAQHQGEPVVMPQFDMQMVMMCLGGVRGAVLTSNQCHALAQMLNACSAEVARLNGVKPIEQAKTCCGSCPGGCVVEAAKINRVKPERCFHCNQPGGQCCTTVGASQ